MREFYFGITNHGKGKLCANEHILCAGPIGDDYGTRELAPQLWQELLCVGDSDVFSNQPPYRRQFIVRSPATR